MKKKTSMILQNKTLIGASILAFFVCSSKNLIIYNEEILVALSFLLFVIFSFHSFQETVKQTFQDRQQTILNELEQVLVTKATTIKNLQMTHTKSLQLVQSLEALKKTAVEELEMAQSQRIQAFETKLKRKCLQKLQTILALEKQWSHELHQQIGSSFQQSVLAHFYKNQATLLPQFIDQACLQLKKK